LRTLVVTSFIFLIGAWNNWYGLEATIVLFFVALTCLGLTNPNASALALAPFSKNAGSASALLGFTQIGVAGLSSAGIGLFDSTNSIPVASIMAGTSLVAFFILMVGRKRISSLHAESHENTVPAAH
jgi:DHA1 family bicyclomycin/chloramphenicol resistance-like MFS transporter